MPCTCRYSRWLLPYKRFCLAPESYPIFMADLQALFTNYPAILYFAAAILGLIIGSFLNVVIHRLPRMLEQDWIEQCQTLLESQDPPQNPEPSYNLVTPGSHCPACNHKITAKENIPVISFLIQKGKCSACGIKISWRYPMVEILTAVLSLAVIWKFGFSAQALAALLLTWALIALAFIDLDCQLLPDNITLPFLWLGLLISLFVIFVPLQASVIGAISGYLSLWIIFQLFKLATGKEGMGFGDFKLYALLGAWLGWQMLPLVILLASAVGAVLGLATIIFRGADKNQPIPFGPFLCSAGWIALIWGDQITRSYLQFAHIPY